jgi:hypothetical protein
MRIALIVLAAIFAPLGIVSQASAQATPIPISVVGNNIAMYLDDSCPGTSCSISFGLNNTGRVLKVTHISCRILVTNNSGLLYTSFGPSATPGGSLIREGFFGTWTRVENPGLPIFYLSASPDMLVGIGRYLSVSGQSAAGQVQMKCQAAGVFAQ